ncbi:MAG: DUF2029 domain-containing protein, partial [Nitrospinaceae bacterium]|nr:DUF2029 domain-containing protein [Nitrospinaceae bacterium]
PVASAKNRWLLMDHRTDLSVYTWAGAAFFDERDPYEVVNPRGWKYLYPPLFAILMAPLNFFPPQWQGVVWYFLSLLMAWGCYRETVRLYHLCGKTAGTSQKKESRTVRWILAGTVATVLFPALDCLQRGQVGILILYLLLLGFRLVMENRAPLKVAAGGMVLALAVTFKIIPLLPALFLLYLLLVRRLTRPASGGTGFQEWSAAGGMALGLVLFVFIIPSLFLGWQANWKYLNVWTAKVGVHAVEISQDSNFSNPTSPRNQSLNNAMYHAGNRVAYWFSRGTEPTPWDFRDNRNRFMNSPT